MSARPRPRRPTGARTRAAGAYALCALLGACASPFTGNPETDALRHSLLERVRSETLGDRTPPAGPTTLSRRESDLGLSPERISELQEYSGLGSYPDLPGALGSELPEDLLGGRSEEVSLSLDEAVQRAIRHNLEGRSARLDPAVSAEQEIVADAAFDWLLFADLSAGRTDNPTAVPVVNGVPVGTALNLSNNYAANLGLRRLTRLGGTVTLEASADVFNNRAPGFNRAPDPSKTANLDLTVSQPLLRGFGRDTNLSQVRLSANATESAAETVRRTLIDVLTETEAAYWSLAVARREHRIRRRLLERGIETRDALRGRLGFDVTQAELADAVATVEQRRADLIRSANTVRTRSDELKRLLNAPDEPLESEVVIIPTDEPPETPIEFSLVDSLTSAVTLRPEVRIAHIAIRDADIREMAARDAVLPLLTLDANVNLTGLENEVSDAFANAVTDEFVDYNFALRFERPIGNRAAEADLRSARLERLRAVVDYRDAVQAAALEVKTALRNVSTNYRLIEQTRILRLAAAENLRALQAEEETIRSLTPEFLDLKLTRQEALANAEIQEAQALSDYASSLAELDRAVGRTLERRGVSVVVPRGSVAEEFLEEGDEGG